MRNARDIGSILPVVPRSPPAWAALDRRCDPVAGDDGCAGWWLQYLSRPNFGQTKKSPPCNGGKWAACAPSSPRADPPSDRGPSRCSPAGQPGHRTL